MGRMSEKVAVITGGANGLGRATALRFAQEGAKGIVIADMLEESGLETVKMVQNAGGKATYVSLDAVNRLENQEMIDVALERVLADRVAFSAVDLGCGNGWVVRKLC